MLPANPRNAGRSFGPRRAAAASVLALAIVFGSVVPAFAVDACIGDECDAGAWKIARGETNEKSYWGMSPGHNCTNYVAWRLIGAGVSQPRTHPGDATTWAERAIADGYLVDAVPTVGSVAHWTAGAGGNGPDGHVAYVEAVNEDGTILISEDFWHGGDQLGPLTYRIVDPATVSNFIHYLDTTDWLRQVVSTDAGWQVRGTGIDPTASAMSALRLAGTDPTIFFSADGLLQQADSAAGTWTVTSTGVRSTAETLAAVTMRQRPFVVSIDEGLLILNASTESGWQRMNTGIEITGEVAAVDLGGLVPTIYISQGGFLYEVWLEEDGWHAQSTGIEIWGPISAVVPESGWPEIFSVENGLLFRAWQDIEGWHRESTGITASGRTSATTVGGVVSVVLDQDDDLYRIDPTETGWLKRPLGIQGGTVLTTVDMGGTAPLILQLG